MQEKTEQKSKVKELIISFVGIYASYISGGYLVEKINGTDYSGRGEKINHTVAIVILQSIFSTIFGIILCKIYPSKAVGMTIPTQLKVGIYTFISLVAGLQGNINLNFVTNNLVQNCKSLAIVAIAAVGGKFAYKKNEIIVVLLLTAGIFIYFSDFENTNSKTSNWIGWTTCAVSLISSGLLGSAQNVATNVEKSTSYDLLKYTNFWAGICALLYSIANQEIFGYIAFYPQYPRALVEVLVLVLTGVSGQYFIYYTIENFSPLFLSIVSTSRKFVNIFISILVFGHRVTIIQYFGIFMILLGVGFEIYAKAKSSAKKSDVKKTN